MEWKESRLEEIAREENIDTSPLQELPESLQRTIYELTENAYTDPRTGLSNDRAYEVALPKELKKNEDRLRAGEAENKGIAIYFIDLDKFKTVNDDYGYEAGNEVLQAAANGIKRVVHRPKDRFRWGGDEFAAIYNVKDEAEAEAVKEELRRHIETGDSAYVEKDGTEFRIHPDASIGYHFFKPGYNAQTALNEVTAAMEAMRSEKRLKK